MEIQKNTTSIAVKDSSLTEKNVDRIKTVKFHNEFYGVNYSSASVNWKELDEWDELVARGYLIKTKERDLNGFIVSAKSLNLLK